MKIGDLVVVLLFVLGCQALSCIEPKDELCFVAADFVVVYDTTIYHDANEIYVLASIKIMNAGNSDARVILNCDSSNFAVRYSDGTYLSSNNPSTDCQDTVHVLANDSVFVYRFVFDQNAFFSGESAKLLAEEMVEKLSESELLFKMEYYFGKDRFISEGTLRPETVVICLKNTDSLCLSERRFIDLQRQFSE